MKNPLSHMVQGLWLATVAAARSALIIGWIVLTFSALTSCAQSNPDAQPPPVSSSSSVDPVLPVAQQEGQHTNRLIDETSPYLLMHAHNPVNWYPWSAEALQKAKDENKVIFLSIGYSSCHWCHVMERESFLDPEIAKFMNDHFVCIKVDREERPDVDDIYMTSLQVYNQVAGTGRGGGWPLSMFLTPAAEPFFGGTYFPARDGDRGARMGFLSILETVHASWNEKRDQINRDAQLLTRLTRQQLEGEQQGDPPEIRRRWLSDCLVALQQEFDPEYGGFGFRRQNPMIPKFPEPSNLFFLIDVIRQDNGRAAEQETAKNMLVTTLQRMAMGGIYDHLGGGFHRYSVDRFWNIPHFEKMLYDNGLLLSVYVDAYQITGRDEFRAVAQGIAEFVLREMTDPQGGFYAALDAESENEEGKFYRWEKSEVEASLSQDDYALFAQVYGIDRAPNFEGRYYAPQLAKPPVEIAEALELTFEQWERKLAPIRSQLLEVRSRRERPLTDNKILTSWNGLMIRGLADAGRVLEQPELLEAATRAADFLWEHSQVDGRLKRTFTDGQARFNAYLDDYAFFIDGMIALHRASGQQQWLDRAVSLQEKQNELFWDEAQGGYFFTSSDHESLLARAKKPTDAAIPSGNSVAAGNLLYLAQHTGNESFRNLAERTVKNAGPLLDRFSSASPRMLLAVRLLTEKADTENNNEK